MTQSDDIAELTAHVQELTNELTETREVMVIENEKRDIRIATNRRLNKTAIATAAVGVLAGLIGIGSAVHFANQATERGHALSAQVARNEHDRAEARVTGCNQYNEQQRAAYAAELVQARILVRALVPNLAVADAETRERVDKYLVEHDTQSAISHTERDCSPAGIEAYYAGKRSGEAFPPVPSVPSAG